MEEGDTLWLRKGSQQRPSAVSLQGRKESKAFLNQKRRLTVSQTLLRSNLLSRHTSIWGSSFSFSREPQTPKVRYLNSYRLDSKYPFNRDLVTSVLKDTLEREISLLKKYDPDVCKKLCRLMAEEIRTQVRSMEFDRYKIVTRVYIVEKLQQGIHINSCFLWDAERDTFATYQFENMYVRAVASVYGLYCE
ncbi:dynein light chain Tctex-type 5-like [Hetaerina americana]|uniref:dynein light chain Tctex-type 5-like n=1 Tax=Hetaerina americana TaxID=62018 RepID=UPI003A7F5792